MMNRSRDARITCLPSCGRAQRAGPGADRHRKGWARVDRGLPVGELGIGRALDRKFQTTLDDRTERNVGDGETIERKPIALGDVASSILSCATRSAACAVKSGARSAGAFLASLNTATYGVFRAPSSQSIQRSTIVRSAGVAPVSVGRPRMRPRTPWGSYEPGAGI